jgi:tetratricopeptide (TPR) repeat protein
MEGCAGAAATEQTLIAFCRQVDSSWPAWIGNLANLMQLVSPAVALLTVLITRWVTAGHRQTPVPSSPQSTIGTRHVPGVWLSEQTTGMDYAGELVEVILGLTGWTQVRLVHELRASARSLQEPEPLGLDPVTVNRWRRGRQRPSPYYSRLLQHLHSRVSREAIEPRPSIRQPPDHRVVDIHEAEDMKRRRFLQYLTVLAQSVIVDPDMLGSALQARSRVDGSLLDSLEAVTRGFARQWHAAPPQLLLPCVQHHLEVLNELRLQSHPAAIGQRLRGLAADAAALVGWETWLSGDRTSADAYYALARELAGDVGHDTVQGFVLVARSFVYSGLFGASMEVANQPVGLLDEAVAVAARTTSPYLRAFALLRRAEERAATAGAGAAVAVLGDLDAAEAVLTAVRVKDDGFFHYADQERAAGSRGTCAALLGDTTEAVRILSQVIATTPPSLAAERSVLITDLASVYAQKDEVDYACELLGRSLSLGHGSDVNRTERIVGVRRTLLRRWADVPSVRRLDEQLELHRAGAA